MILAIGFFIFVSLRRRRSGNRPKKSDEEGGHAVPQSRLQKFDSLDSHASSFNSHTPLTSGAKRSSKSSTATDPPSSNDGITPPDAKVSAIMPVQPVLEIIGFGEGE